MRLLFVLAVVAIAVVIGWSVWRPTVVSVTIPFHGDAAEIVYASGAVEPMRFSVGLGGVGDLIADIERSCMAIAT